jgi:hypothetical protein
MTDDDMQFLRELINPYDNPTSVARAEMELSNHRDVQPWRLDAQPALTILFLFACLPRVFGSANLTRADSSMTSLRTLATASTSTSSM